MKFIKMRLSLFFLIFISLSAKAGHYCNLLWANNTLPNASVNVSFDGNTSGIFPLNVQAGGLSTVIKRYVENMDGFVTVDGTYRYWIQYPEGWQATPEGLKYRILSDLAPSGVQVPGVKTVVTPAGHHKWVNTFGCFALGGTYDFGTTVLSGIKLEIDRGNAWPGLYSIQLPVKVAYEENKGNYTGQNGGGWTEYSSAMKNFAPVDSKNIHITITSKCDISEQNLSINMGDNITPEEARVGVEKNVNVSLTCNALAKISLSLKGTDIIDGINNKTKCGSGSCTLTFDNGNARKIIDINKGVYQVPIIVRFQNHNAIAGAFYGNAVLSVDIL
ncbi:TPA: nuclease PIN [Escherichia coli]|nr:nuclease PIN [Escherichia coli]HEL8550153.1 nuclease PIN [Escherichia coli]HEM0025825.1 nuclease PIN [Escherichia coli]